MPLVTLTSDLGVQNHALASIKGKLFSTFPTCKLVDISHNISGFNLQQAVYIFKQTYLHFPKDTYHFVLNDLFADQKRQLLYVYENGHHIFCGDNGFLTMLFDEKPIQIFKLNDLPNRYNLLTVADAFISNIVLLEQNNKSGLDNIDVQQILIKVPNRAFENNNMIEAQVLFIDNFGNVILNITQQQFEEARGDRKFKILFMRDDELITISQHYNDVPLGEKLCLFNIAGHLEIAVNKGSAAQLFGFKESTEQSFFYNNIKVFFE